MQHKVEFIVGIFVLAALAILVYMASQIGAFRFDRIRYNTYSMNCKDVSGLSRKAMVKIAGVNVGLDRKHTAMQQSPCSFYHYDSLQL